uniref:diacylglycerol O-acyltransferase n=1 Tax=Aegilops tauschii subsp. strangulata TaxID=200361 RepID=A0A453DPN0_AEGTS
MQVAMSAATHSSRPLSVRVSREKECADNSIVEPMSPTGRVMEELGVCIVVVIGLGTPVNLPVFRAGIETELLTRFPRFRSIQVMDESTNNSKPRWVQTPVNMDDHIVVPRLDPEADPEKAVEDYVASLSLLPMDRRRPLWEFHFLDFPSSEAASTVVLRLHHSIGDGTSITTLLMASSRSTADPARVPAMPPPPKRTGAIYQREPRPRLSSDY